MTYNFGDIVFIGFPHSDLARKLGKLEPIEISELKSLLRKIYS
jgi:hypothetical protein